MKKLIKLKFSEVSGYFRYCPKTGNLYRTKLPSPKTNTKVRIGQIAGSKTRQGYIQVRFKMKKIMAHRLAWLLFYGELPNSILDHINGNTSDNRINNLREVTDRQNSMNQKCHRNGKLVGAVLVKKTGMWQSAIRVNGKVKHLGNFKTSAEANAAYLRAFKDLN